MLQRAAQGLGGSPLLDLHVKDLGNRSHPSDYDYTSVYDLVIFRRLATDHEVRVELGEAAAARATPLAAFSRIRTRAVGFVVFDRLLITVHPAAASPPARHRALPAGRAAERGPERLRPRRLPTGAADLMCACSTWWSTATWNCARS